MSNTPIFLFDPTISQLYFNMTGSNNRKIIETKKKTFTKNTNNRETYYSYVVTRIGDITQSTWLLLNLNNINNNTSFQEILDKLGSSRFIIEANQCELLNVQLSFLVNLDNFKLKDNKLFINLNLDISLGDLFIAPIAYTQLVLKVTNIQDDNLIESVSIIMKDALLDTNGRRNLVTESHNLFVQNIQTNIINLDNAANKIIKILDFNYLSKGIFLECNNINNNLKNIKLNIHNVEIINYDKDLIELCTYKISGNLLYLPFSGDLDYKNKDRASYVSALAFGSTIPIIELDFDISINKIKIYNLHSNILRVMHGMCGLTYSGNFVTEYTQEDTVDVVTERLNRHRLEREERLRQQQAAVARDNNQDHQDHRYDLLVTVYKLLNTDKNTDCPISMLPINNKDKYCVCDGCSYNFREDAINNWLINNNTCPMCRARWTSNYVYINSIYDNNTEEVERDVENREVERVVEREVDRVPERGVVGRFMNFIGHIADPVGATGARGATGPVRATGARGATGSVGATGSRGNY